jgi:hypothetical protein
LLVLVGVTLVVGVVWGMWSAWSLWSSSRYEESLRLFEEAGLPASLREMAPLPPPAAENAAPLYLKAIDQVSGIPDVRLESYKGAISDDVRRAVASAGKALQLMHAAAERPRCVFEEDYDDPSRVLPVAEFMKLSRLLAARAVLRSQDGDLDSSLADLRALFHAARSLHEEPWLLRQIVRLAIDGLGLEALEVVLPRCDSAEDALEQVELDIARGAMAQGIRGETALGTELVLRDSLDPDEIGLDRTSALYWTLRMRSVTGPYLKSEATAYLDFMRRYLEALDDDYPAAIAAAERLESEFMENAGILLNIFVVHTASHVRREACIVSRLALARVAARCLDHRRQHGAYPESLSEVDSDLIDPFCGKPFVLSRRGGRPALESPEGGGSSWTLPDPPR